MPCLDEGVKRIVLFVSHYVEAIDLNRHGVRVNRSSNPLTLNAPLLLAVKFSSHYSQSSLQDCYRT